MERVQPAMVSLTVVGAAWRGQAIMASDGVRTSGTPRPSR